MKTSVMSITRRRNILTLSILFVFATFTRSQGFLHTSNKSIVDGAGENVILRGIGTGNWMLMEGYMMNTPGVAGTQHEFEAKLKETIGEEKTNKFFDTWLENHFTRTDVDSMKAWGFNSVRAALHYKCFTLPIEEEPVSGENTWLEKGFVMVDSLLQWCADNEMYLILDMHGTPGGQGKNADISDYDPSKPSLWESEENRSKLTSLWYALAKRYQTEPWIGGYDLINETNWDFENSGNENGVNCVRNIPLLELHKRLIDTIRTIDNNHIVFVSGNSWGNNYNGMNSLASHDDNVSFTFHKYWSGNDENALDWIIQKRNQLNVPLWMSESGENSNTWFTDAITLFETNNIGWSWWPVKKDGINNVMKVTFNKDYENLIKYWKGEAPKPTEEEAFSAVMQWAENHKIENCEIKFDVIDAMMRQPYTDEIIPFNEHKLTQPIFFSEFDYGKYQIAYWDTYVANYGGEWTGWNNGWGLRNDGVDIESCEDSGVTNGYNVGWTDDGEWMQYTLSSDSAASYTLHVRHASKGNGSKVHLEVNNANVTGELFLPGTGGDQNWKTAVFENVIMPAGPVKLKFVIDKGGANLNYFLLDNPQEINDVDFHFVSIETSMEGSEILLGVNKPVTVPVENLAVEEFTLYVNSGKQTINEIQLDDISGKVLKLKLNTPVYSDQSITLSYNGSSVISGDQVLTAFSNEKVQKNMAESKRIPGKIQAEDFYKNKGLELETCTDDGGGHNTAYANTGDYLLYRTHVFKTGYYKVIYRVSTDKSNADLVFQVGDGTTFNNLATTRFTRTGGWQNWEYQFADVYLDEGYHYIKLYIKQGEHNLNWFQLNFTGTPVSDVAEMHNYKVYPNPAKDRFTMDLGTVAKSNKTVELMNLQGKTVYASVTSNDIISINTEKFESGIYLIKVSSGDEQNIMKLQIIK